MNFSNDSQLLDTFESQVRRNLSENKEIMSGYDLPAYGLDNGQFYSIHVSAIVCILSSLICAIACVVISFRHQSYQTFFTKWTKSERFILYMALCDGLFNISHSLDHIHMVVSQNHVYPKELCEFYGFCLTWFIAAQMLLVNVVAINIFMLMYFNININFGRRDWRLLLWTFGLPLLVSVAAAVTGQFGPAGISCFFDSVKGQTAVWFTTVPTLVIMVVNIILYILTWKRIRDQTSAIQEAIHTTATAKASRNTARTMSLFVTAFLVQWFSVGVHSVWDRIDLNIHPIMLHIVVILPNLGGCFNLAVCLLIRRKRTKHHDKSKGNWETDTWRSKRNIYTMRNKNNMSSTK